MIDLHCHSIFSDGDLSPERLIQKAQQQQVKCLSLTDHDTVAGYPRLHKAALDSGVSIINGIELSTRWKKYDIHILGYQIKPTADLDTLIQLQSQNRITRAIQIGAALEILGIEMAYQKACELAGHQRIGRPHFAQLLVNEGRAKDLQAAFKQFLIRGKKAYIPTHWINVQEAVTGIIQAGGRAVIAHPLKYGLTRTKLHELIIDFKEAGGHGIEVVSGEMTVNQISEATGICLRFKLLASTGSDFHSENRSRINLGCQRQLPISCTPIWHDWTI